MSEEESRDGYQIDSDISFDLSKINSQHILHKTTPQTPHTPQTPYAQHSPGSSTPYSRIFASPFISPLITPLVSPFSTPKTRSRASSVLTDVPDSLVYIAPTPEEQMNSKNKL